MRSMLVCRYGVYLLGVLLSGTNILLEAVISSRQEACAQKVAIHPAFVKFASAKQIEARLRCVPLPVTVLDSGALSYIAKLYANKEILVTAATIDADLVKIFHSTFGCIALDSWVKNEFREVLVQALLTDETCHQKLVATNVVAEAAVK